MDERCATGEHGKPGRRLAARLRDGMVRRWRPRWIHDPLTLSPFPYDRFAPLRPTGLPDGRRLWVVAPHPDDESIGCGGLIARWTEAGREARVVFLTAGEAGDPALRDGRLPPEAAARRRAEVATTRRAEASMALSMLDATGHWLDGHDGALWRDEARIVPQLAALWRKAPPDVIAAPFPADRHPDHAVAARIVGAAGSAVLPASVPVWAYEVWSPCPANAVLDIATVASRKARAIAAHASQIATTDYAAAAAGLATYRAVTAGLGPGQAEAFHVADLSVYAALAARLRV